jgi:hypothetical protein
MNMLKRSDVATTYKTDLAENIMQGQSKSKRCVNIASFYILFLVNA